MKCPKCEDTGLIPVYDEMGELPVAIECDCKKAKIVNLYSGNKISNACHFIEGRLVPIISVA